MGHFLTCSKIWLNPPHNSIRLAIRTVRISIRWLFYSERAPHSSRCGAWLDSFFRHIYFHVYLHTLKGLSSQVPHRDEWGAQSERKKARTIRTILSFLNESAIRGGSGKRYVLADWHPNRCRTLWKYRRINTKSCRMGRALSKNDRTSRMPLPCLSTSSTQLLEWTIQCSWR